MLLGFILGPVMEEYLRRALPISKGDPAVFVTRPISAVLLALYFHSAGGVPAALLKASGHACSSGEEVARTVGGSAHGGKAWDHSAMVRALETMANFEIGQPEP
jgi:hypothetical protein